MANPWFPSGSASAFSPPLDTAGDSRSSTPPLPPDPPDPSCPFQDPISGNTVAHLPVSKNLIQNPPTPPSPTLTAATTSSSPPLILDTPLNPNAFTPPTLNSAPPFKAASNTNNTQTNKPARPQPPLVERLRLSNDKSLSRLAPVSISDTGRPCVLIPDSVFLKGAEMHKYFIVRHFNGRLPPFSQIQSVLNHMWG
ncbi:proline-rich receptor-like protein kinase PERK2 [Brassica napus]|uniref:proline-rich receptor-like protein kinase PERK2 n=1 Tax=Brassica napus TaxID=3708 RepID=UPI0020793E80|nr:proline-rich receptor-like protein kinase PERK2 [Brassica napus]